MSTEGTFDRLLDDAGFSLGTLLGRLRATEQALTEQAETLKGLVELVGSLQDQLWDHEKAHGSKTTTERASEPAGRISYQRTSEPVSDSFGETVAARCPVCNDSGHTCRTCGALGDGCPACSNHVPPRKLTDPAPTPPFGTPAAVVEAPKKSRGRKCSQCDGKGTVSVGPLGAMFEEPCLKCAERAAKKNKRTTTAGGSTTTTNEGTDLGAEVSPGSRGGPPAVATSDLVNPRDPLVGEGEGLQW